MEFAQTRTSMMNKHTLMVSLARANMQLNSAISLLFCSLPTVIYACFDITGWITLNDVAHGNPVPDTHFGAVISNPQEGAACSVSTQSNVNQFIANCQSTTVTAGLEYLSSIHVALTFEGTSNKLITTTVIATYMTTITFGTSSFTVPTQSRGIAFATKCATGIPVAPSGDSNTIPSYSGNYWTVTSVTPTQPAVPAGYFNYGISYKKTAAEVPEPEFSLPACKGSGSPIAVATCTLKTGSLVVTQFSPSATSGQTLVPSLRFTHFWDVKSFSAVGETVPIPTGIWTATVSVSTSTAVEI